MYGYVSGDNNPAASELILNNNEEFERLKSQYPEHEIYLFAGDKIDMALFFAPGLSVMLLKTRASLDEIF